jgi:hypothetical protein
MESLFPTTRRRCPAPGPERVAIVRLITDAGCKGQLHHFLELFGFHLVLSSNRVGRVCARTRFMLAADSIREF